MNGHAEAQDQKQFGGGLGDRGRHSAAHTLALLPIILPTLPWCDRLGQIGDDKYLHITEDTIMDTLDDFYTTSTDDRLDAQRDIIRESLNEIATDIGMAMRDEGLHFPVYITVRNSGDSLATIATPLDPSDA